MVPRKTIWGDSLRPVLAEPPAGFRRGDESPGCGWQSRKGSIIGNIYPIIGYFELKDGKLAQAVTLQAGPRCLLENGLNLGFGMKEGAGTHFKMLIAG